MEKNKKKYSKRKCIIAVMVAVIVCIFCYYENNHLVVSEYTYMSDKVAQEFDGFRIVHISDLHNKLFGKGNERLIGRIEEHNPDIIVITGDIVDSYRTDVDVAVDFVRESASICPVYYVTGNHELRLKDEEFDRLMAGLSDAGAVILDNELVQINRDESAIAIVGVDDACLQGSTLSNLLMDNESLALVLAHEPDYLKKYAASGADIVFSGHAHGGQFRIPGVGGLVAPGQGILPDLTEGIHTEGNTQMVISRGLGNSIIPIRILNDPEVVCVDLKSEK